MIKIRKYILDAILILSFFVLQTTVFKSISLAGVAPNLMLILTVLHAYMRGRTEGLLIGFICGLLCDFYSSVIGPLAFIYMAIGFVVGHCRKFYFRDEFIIPTLLVAASNLVYGIYYYLVEFLLRGKTHFIFYFIHIILPEVIYTVLISLLVYRLLQFTEPWLVLKDGRED